MSLSSYRFCAKGEVTTVPNGDSFSVLIDGKFACSTATGGPHRFPSELQAEVFGRQLVRGYNRGSYLSEDVANFIA